MGTETLAQVRLHNGRYEGLLTASAPTELELVHGGTVIGLANVIPDGDQTDSYLVTADLPASVLSDGVQIVSLRSVSTGAVLGRITLMAGSALDEDFRAELATLRDELEMLKTAFRRHCTETSQD